MGKSLMSTLAHTLSIKTRHIRHTSSFSSTSSSSSFSSSWSDDLDSVHDFTAETRASAAGSAASSAPEANKLDANLAERLRHLKAHPRTSATLNWLVDATKVAIATQSAISAAACGHAPPDVLDRTVALLDVCNALKSVAVEAAEYVARLQLGLRSLAEAGDSAVHTAGRRLVSCLQSTESGNRRRWSAKLSEACASLDLLRAELKTAKVDASGYAFDGATLATLLILATAASSFSSAAKTKHSRSILRTESALGRFTRRESSRALWVAPLKELQRDLAQEESRAAGGAVFQELESLHNAATALAVLSTSSQSKEVSALMRLGAESLRKRARSIEASMTDLAAKLAELFNSLAAARISAMGS